MYFNDINGIMKTSEIYFDPFLWSLFIASSKTSLKTVLLQNGNILPSEILVYAAYIEETYENMN